MLGEYFDLIIFLFGLLLIFFYKKVALMSAKFNEKFLSKIPPKIKYSEKDIQATQYIFLIGGLIIVIYSLLAFLGINILK